MFEFILYSIPTQVYLVVFSIIEIALIINVLKDNNFQTRLLKYILIIGIFVLTILPMTLTVFGHGLWKLDANGHETEFNTQ